jgi:hypothetical protein
MVNLRTNATSALALVRDEVAAGEEEIALAEEHLPKHGFHIQHLYWLLAKAHVSMYRGEAAAADELLVAQWPSVKRSLLLSVQSIRILLREARARACVMRLASGGPAGAARTAEDLARAIEREGWGAAIAQAHVVRAGLARIAGDRDGAAAHLIAAERGFSSLGMGLLTAVVRRRRGAILGGKEGAALVEAGDDWMASHGVKNPDRMTALFAPGSTP